MVEAIDKGAEESRTNALKQAISSADICVFYQSTDLVYRWAENLPQFLQDKWSTHCRDGDFLDYEIAETMETLKLKALATGERQSFETRFESGGQTVWYKFSIDCERQPDGKICGLITTGIDVSELRRREQILKILLREVSHRSKNLLAIIQSIATQTARYSTSMKQFMGKFQGRIRSLSSAQDLVTDSNWQGAFFQTLLRAQVAGYLDEDDARIKIVGDDPYLYPAAALHIGLAIHELIINSLTFGALTKPDGQVWVAANIEDAHEGDSGLFIRWHEEFAAKGREQAQENSFFGATVLERIVPSAVFGTAQLKISDKDVDYTLKVPSSQFDQRA